VSAAPEHDDSALHPIDALAEELIERLRAGETPTAAEYVARHPELEDEIEELFPTLLMVERAAQRSRSSTPSPVVHAGPAPTRLGDFRIVREVGRGGMGVVYEAVQESLGRRVALKLLSTGGASPKARERFQREAQAAATLHHTNIVQVFGVGAQDGALYYVMQFIEGRSLEDLIQAGEAPLDARRAAQVAEQIAEGLAHAHAQGVLHRDVKPANVMIDARDTAWIMDFGLAKVLGAEDGITETGDVLGTVRYLPPERLEGRADERGDVYGLGLTLYELLTGVRAFPSSERGDVLRLIRDVGPAAPRGLRPDLPRDLETIVLKAIAREHGERYASAGALRDDLRRWLEDRPIAARRAGPLERGWRWCRRNRALAALTGIASGSLAFGAVVGWVGYLATTDALKRESQRRAEAEAATLRAEENEQLSLVALEGIFDALAGTERTGPPFPGFVPGGADGQDEVKLLQTVIDFYDGYAARNQTDPQLKLEAARATRRVAMLRARLGDRPGAAEAFARSIERFELLRAQSAGEASYDVELASTLLDSAMLLLDGEGADAALAEERIRRARGLLEGPAASARPDLPVVARFRHSIALAKLGRLSPARAALDEALAARAVLVPSEPQPPVAGGRDRDGPEAERFMRATVLGGEAVLARGALAEALVALGNHTDAVALLEDAVRDFGQGRTRRYAAPLLTRLAVSYRAVGREADAVEAERLAEEWRDRRGGGRRDRGVGGGSR
jgi:predicted Ser/Thr protein kinase/tetratricopeptide (TPR) repeat protein